jgi:hypothetical protein
MSPRHCGGASETRKGGMTLEETPQEIPTRNLVMHKFATPKLRTISRQLTTTSASLRIINLFSPNDYNLLVAKHPE